jgi:hypothetical protein
VVRAVEVALNQLSAISVGIFGNEFLELKANMMFYSYDSSTKRFTKG